MLIRLKREECKRTKHDSVFSKWEILVGPSDWEDYALGKRGVERYRIHNLPLRASCPGLYELGISAIPGDDSCKSRRHASNSILVLYLGQADNVRSRLQQYGRTGSHLDCGNSIALEDSYRTISIAKRPGLFQEVFSRGYSILFRWAPMINKKEAEKIEAQLLDTFDYAWNTRGNGASRREEILLKLDTTVTRSMPILFKKLEEWKQRAYDKKIGINIDASVPLDESELSTGLKHYLIPRVRKLLSFQPQSIEASQVEILHRDDDICGFVIGDGSVCRSKPTFRNKRCKVHKGQRIIRTVPGAKNKTTETKDDSSVCDTVSGNDSICAEFPSHLLMQCKEHEGREVNSANPLTTSDSQPFEAEFSTSDDSLRRDFIICGVVLCADSVCMNRPRAGRKRCELHKGQRIIQTKLSTIGEHRATNRVVDITGEYNICGVFLGDGDVCRKKPVQGRERCEEHKGMRIKKTLSRTYKECSRTKELSSVCGVRSDDGSICIKSSVSGRKRCELHKGRRVT